VPNITIFGALGCAAGEGRYRRWTTASVTTDIDLSGEVYACGDRQVIFKLYPIYQTSDGRIYLTRGNSMGMSGADGASITHTLTSDKTETIGGKSERVKVRVAITVAARPTPTKFTVAHMDENDDLLKLEEFAPDALPESITAAMARRISSARAMDKTGTARRRNTTFAAAAMTVLRMLTQIWIPSAIRTVSSAQSASRSTGGRNSMKRLIAFALALAVVFGVSFALYKPERIEAAAQETMDDEWVGYFFVLEPFDGRRYATENGDDYDFGVPGVPVFVTITAFEPDDPDYEEGSEFNNSVGAAVSDEVVGSGMHIKVDETAAATRRAERSRSTRCAGGTVRMLCLPHVCGGLLCRVHAGQRHERMLQDTQRKPEPDADDLDRAVERLARERQNAEPLDQGERFVCGAHGGRIGRICLDGQR